MRLWLVAVVAVALAVRLGVVAATPSYVPRHDDRDYDRIGWSMASGRGYPPLRIGGHAYAQAYRPPLWPATLGLVYSAAGHRVPAARVADAAVGAAGVALLGWVALRLYGRGVARWAAALGAAYLPLALVSSVLVSETLEVALALLALALALEARRRDWKWAVAAGAVAGLAALTRVNGAVVLLAVVPLTWTGPRRGLAVLLAFAAVLAPWTVRNALELRAFVPVSTEAGVTLAGTYNHAAMTDRYAPGAWLGLRHTEYARLAHAPMPPAEHDRVLRRAALRFIGRHPLYPLAVAWHNTGRWLDLAGRGRARFEASTIGITRRWADAALPFAWALAGLAALGLILSPPRGAFWLAPLALLASTLLVNAETPRFRAPLDPFLILLAAQGLHKLSGLASGAWSLRSSPRWRSRRATSAPV
jgi:4-amino-4-deoxy-L-arabinose transferase-like glycosyltransferase